MKHQDVIERFRERFDSTDSETGLGMTFIDLYGVEDFIIAELDRQRENITQEVLAEMTHSTKFDAEDMATIHRVINLIKNNE